MIPALKDRHERPLRNLRLSVTDRCNLRCSYCMPEAEYVWLPREDILHFEEIERLVDVFCGLGVDKVRLTGGEPLLRRDVPELVRRLAARPRIRRPGDDDERRPARRQRGSAQGRRAAPPHGEPRHARRRALQALTRSDELDRVLAGHRRRGAALSRAEARHGGHSRRQRRRARGAHRVRRPHGAEVRFIEYMDVGGATHWSMPTRGLAARDTRTARGRITARSRRSSNSRRRRPIASDCRTGGCSASSRPPPSRSATRAIAAVSRPTACGTCACTPRRHRLAQGPARRGERRGIAELVRATWKRARPRRRGPPRERRSLAADSPRSAATDPHLEMHTRGG